MKKVAIIGAGITGLSAAFELQENGIDCALFEASGRVGGCISSIRKDGYLVECGPNSILETHPDVGDLIVRLGIEGNKVPASVAAKNRYIVRNGQPVALPTSPPAFFRSKAFSANAKLRFLKETFIRSKGTEQESLADFVRRRLGSEILDYAINPFVSGVYAGNPEKLSTAHAFPKLYALEQNYGSLIKGAVKGAKERKKRAEKNVHEARMYTFDDGMEVLPLRLAEKLGYRVNLNTPVESIQMMDEGVWMVNREEFSDVLLAIPAHQMPELNTPFDLDLFAEIEYPAVASVSLGFDLNSIMHSLDGFGMLIPEVEKKFSLGALFPSSIFPERAPGGTALLTVFVGGARAPERALMNKSEMLANVLGDLRDLLGINAEPDFVHTTVWPKAIPQYTVGYERFKKQMTEIEAHYPGIHFAGHYRDGISVSNSLLSGLRIADKISTQRGKER